MSSYTPFLTESLYQSLRAYIPASVNLGPDSRSIHFLSFPEVTEDYFDSAIELQVKRMQSVIELSRGLREKHSISLKTPLKELVVFHPDPAYHADIKPLQSYLTSELNVRDVIFTSDEERTGVKYRATADWPVLGRKLRKEVGRVKNALPKLSSDEIKAYVKTGKISVDGIELITGDLAVTRYVDLPAEGKFATSTDNDVVVILDIQLHPELESEGMARELINRIQKLRKKAGLQATDDIDVFYSFERDMGEALKEVIHTHCDAITRTTRSTPADASLRKPDAKILLEEAQEIGETKFTLCLVLPNA